MKPMDDKYEQIDECWLRGNGSRLGEIKSKTVYRQTYKSAGYILYLRKLWCAI